MRCKKTKILKMVTFLSIYAFMHSCSFAFEDCVVVTDGKITNVSIENETLLNVYPLVTIMNDKNTLFFQPLNIGETKVSALKNGKEKILFDVKITEEETFIENVQDFEIVSLDVPPENLEIDLPPIKIEQEKGALNG